MRTSITELPSSLIEVVLIVPLHLSLSIVYLQYKPLPFTPFQKVLETAHCYVMLDAFPVARFHCLLLPKVSK
jgi:hypothetical protein